MSLISLNNVSLAYGARRLLSGADLSIGDGDFMALIGRNGCGKTTLLKLITGLVSADSGMVERAKNLKTAYLPQDVPTDLKGCVYSVVAEGLGEAGVMLARHRELSRSNTHTSEELIELDTLTSKIQDADLWELDSRITELIDRLELSADIEISSASAGLKRRALLGKGLIANPDIMLLDEPTNHLDVDSVLWLEKFLKTCGKTLVFVSHDRAFLRSLATRVVEVDRGKLISFSCGFDKFLERRDELLSARERAEAEFDKKLAKEEAWLRQGIKARRTRNEGRVRELMRLREIRSSRVGRQGLIDLKTQDFSTSGQKVLDVKNLTVSYGGEPIIKDFSTTIFRGDKIGIIGRNGVGKTTLLNALLGRIKIDSGEVAKGTNLEVAYFDQLRGELNPEMTPFDFIGGGAEYVVANGTRQYVMGYLQNFLFEPNQVLSQIGGLSGGEKNRLMLAKIFATPANVLVFDEPTNDLDMQTIEILESVLVSFKGTILIVSHDREFLNNIVSGVFCFCGDGRVESLVGGYDEWEKFRQEEQEAIAIKTVQTKQTSSVQVRRKGKLSNKEREELASIPQRIEALEAELADWSEKLGDSDFVIKNADKIADINARMDAIRQEDEALMNRWAELESL